MQKDKALTNVLIVVAAIAFPFLLGAVRAPDFLFLLPPAQAQQVAVSACLNRSNIADADAHWTYIPQNADELYSADNLQWLAGNLILSNVVDASACPAGGLGSGNYANACGLSVALTKVIEVQNSLNQPVLDAWKNVGVPPVLLKQLIRFESQFWPGQSDIHYGFGHVTPIGALSALQWNPNLIGAVCATSSSNCGANSITAQTLLRMMVITCPACSDGIDTSQVNKNVNLLANVVMANCNQTAQLVFNATGWQTSTVVDYGTLWKLTLMDYNSGPTCVFDSVRDAFATTNGPIQWSNIEANAIEEPCNRGVFYANEITGKEYNFPPPQ